MADHQKQTDAEQPLILPRGLVSELFEYLSQRPWREVANVMPVLHSALTAPAQMQEDHLKRSQQPK